MKSTSTLRPSSRRAPSPRKRERPVYSQAWLARYGKTFQRDEVQLVQIYRGFLAPDVREAILAGLRMALNAQDGVR